MHRITLTALDLAGMATTVERQEISSLARQPRRHVDLICIRREVNQRPVLGLEQRSSEIALLILLDRVPPVLPRCRIFQLDRSHRQPVDRQQDVHRRIGRWMTSHLSCEGELVLTEEIIQLVIEPVRRAEIRQCQCLSVKLKPMPQHVKRPLPV